MLYIEMPNALCIVKSDDKKVIYSFDAATKHKVNEQQYNLPEGQKLSYSDGSKMLHSGNYCLLRHWQLPNGEVIDRIAIPWSNLYM